MSPFNPHRSRRSGTIRHLAATYDLSATKFAALGRTEGAFLDRVLRRLSTA